MSVQGGETKERRGLEGVRVLEFPDAKTALCGKLLAQMGSDVALVEPPGGARYRETPPVAAGTSEGLFFWSTNAGKRSVVLDLDTNPQELQAFLKLVGLADVLLDPFPPGHLATLGLDDATLFRANPHLVMASLTNFGQTGPFRDYASSDIVGWAMSGLMSLTGDPSREPLTAPALQGYQSASLWMTIAVLASLYRRLKTGQGARLDLSLQEVLFDMSETAHSFYICTGEIVKRAMGDHPLACPFRVYRSKDGHAFISSSSQRQWHSLLEWMDELGIDVTSMRDPAMDLSASRIDRREEVNAIVTEFALRVDREELFLEGARRSMANGPVRSIPEVLADDQLADRRFFGAVQDPREDRAGVEYAAPGLPFRGRRGPSRGETTTPPRVGQHTAELFDDWSSGGRDWPEPTEPHRTLPLQGVNVVEMCSNISGPIMGRVLSDLGATNVKVEPQEIGEPGRLLVPFADGVRNPNRSYTYQDINRNKLSLPIDMKHPQAQGLALKLAAWADVFLGNYTSGTMARLNVSYETLATANPGLVMGSITGYGQDGPRRVWPCNHPTSAALSGLTGLFAYQGDEPLGFGHSHMDYASGYLGTIGVMEALFRRELTGEGDHVDIAMVECGVNLVGPQILEWAVNGQEARAEGNRAGAMGARLQGCYRCKGQDRWIVITAADDRALEGLAKVTGQDRKGDVGELEQAIAAWAAGMEPWEAFERLQSEGVAAGVVSEGPDLVEGDRHLKAREALARLPHAEMGDVLIPQCPIVLDGSRLTVRTSAPLLGQHTEHVIRQMLDLSEEVYLEYVVAGVV